MQYNAGLGQNFNINLDKQKFPAIYKCNHTSQTTSDSKLIYAPNLIGVYHAIMIKVRMVKIGATIIFIGKNEVTFVDLIFV